ncbi:hypothetical protein AURDEDRAFT_130367 [Auricularia subglabra TFB-10046 SS5]|nr:hypothetical protein AURDEDRAFT_130367 [Auricularia subglabra TFB-10046 SS5]
MLRLAISRAHVAPACLDVRQTAFNAGGASASNSDWLVLLHGSVLDLEFYAGSEQSGWLIDIAHDICDPLQRHGVLCFHAVDNLVPVQRTSRLVAGTYVYQAAVTTTLTMVDTLPVTGRDWSEPPPRICQRVMARDGRCWISGVVRGLCASDIISKHIGGALESVVTKEFCESRANAFNSKFMLRYDHYDMFKKYLLGLHRSPNAQSPDAYIVHGFDAAHVQAHWKVGGHCENPPPGLFRWHYLQCVIKRFGHRDYTEFPDTQLPESEIVTYYGEEDDADVAKRASAQQQQQQACDHQFLEEYFEQLRKIRVRDKLQNAEESEDDAVRPAKRKRTAIQARVEANFKRRTSSFLRAWICHSESSHNR